jgi:tetratricopeptide (TPR) repeat protein
MRRLANGRYLFALVFVLPLITSGELCCAQFTKPTDSKLQLAVIERLQAGQHDEAIALATKAAAEPNPGVDVAETLFTTAKFLFAREKYETSLALLKQIPERFPDSPMASLAWCGIGQVYGKLGDTGSMVSALERGMTGPRKWTEMNIIDASDTHSYACQVLGEHYIKAAQWEKAFKIYSEWRPRSWCGNCAESMKSNRVDHLILCLIQLGKHQEAIEFAWREVAGSYQYDSIPEFAILRLYEEAGQRRDISQLTTELIISAKAQAHQQSRLKHFEKISTRMSKALALVVNGDWKQRLQIFDRARAEDGLDLALNKDVVSWLLIRDPQKTVPIMLIAAKATDDMIVPMGEILSAIDTPASRNGLVKLGISGKGIGHQQEICGLIRARVRDPEPLIAEIKARVPEERKRYDFSWQNPTPFSRQFFAPWPPPKKGSFPRSLPPNVVAELNAK